MKKALYVIPSFMARDEIKSLVEACGPRLVSCETTTDGSWFAIVEATQDQIETLSNDLSYGPTQVW